jgi:5-methylcytosine-specific restriction endonuclease McrA
MRPTGRPWRRARAAVLAASNICHLCGRPGADSVDHIIPRSLGGHLTDPANLRPAHFSCNSSRGNGTRARRSGTPGANPTSRSW